MNWKGVFEGFQRAEPPTAPPNYVALPVIRASFFNIFSAVHYGPLALLQSD